jgi:hypothetical protein
MKNFFEKISHPAIAPLLVFALMLLIAGLSAHAQFNTNRVQSIASTPAFSNTPPGTVSGGVAFSNTPPQRIGIVTNQVIANWVTNTWAFNGYASNFFSGVYSNAFGLDTNSANLLVFTNDGVHGQLYLVKNDPYWVRLFSTNIWTLGPNFPDSSLSNPFLATNLNLTWPSNWWANGSGNAGGGQNPTIVYPTNIVSGTNYP